MMLGLVREGLPRQSAHEETGPAGGVDGCTMLSAGWSRERWGKMHNFYCRVHFFAATADGRVDLGGGKCPIHLVRCCSLGRMHLVKVQEHCRGMD